MIIIIINTMSCYSRNIELVALWPGPKGPSAAGMNLLMTPIVNDFKALFQGTKN